MVVNIRCENEECGQDFKINFSDVEEYKQAGKPFLCPKCEAKVVEDVGEPKQRFEYKTLHVCRQNPQRPDLMDAEWKRKLSDLNEAGQDGWEAVAVLFDGVILLKRGYFE